MTPRSEQELLDATIDLAKAFQWLVHHDRPARTANGYKTAIQGHAGFPDLVLARAGVVLFRELKGYDARGRLGKLTADQIDWGARIDPLTAPARTAKPGGYIAPFVRQHWLFDVWTPDDWDDLIVPTLTQRKEPPQ